MRTVKLIHLPPDDVHGPEAYVLARKGDRELRWHGAFYAHRQDEYGPVRYRARARVYLYDARTGTAHVLFYGACRPKALSEAAHHAARWLGVAAADLAAARRDRTLLFEAATAC